MIRKIAILGAIIALAACSAPTALPVKDCPREGGIGGTGACVIENKAV
ncbi:MAG: hypothetical protein ABJL72_15475 [Roseobacter sp.]